MLPEICTKWFHVIYAIIVKTNKNFEPNTSCIII